MILPYDQFTLSYLGQVLHTWFTSSSQYRLWDIEILSREAGSPYYKCFDSLLTDYKFLHYLNIKVYGNVANGTEILLMIRYFHYFEARYNWNRLADEVDSRWGFAWVPPKQPSYLPNPYNMGQDWYREAIETIKGDRYHWWKWGAWRKFWKRTNVFTEHREEFERFEIEWIEVVFSDFVGLSGI